MDPVDLPQSFGEVHFGQAVLGDKRRTRRLVQAADALVRHPGGTLPEKLRCSGELDGLYHLMKGETVTHESVLAPHRTRTLRKLAEHSGPVLVVHDTTELDYTTHESLTDVGQFGNGSRKGWLCHNSLAVCPKQREVLGLAGQILHRRANPPKHETAKARREREDRESRLWLEGTKSLPTDRKIVDVCDRGADTFEFMEHEVNSGRTFVIRSSYNRGALPGHGDSADRSLLHDFARTLPWLGQWTLSVPAARLEQKPKKTGHKKIVHRKKRDAVLHVSAAPVRVCVPVEKRGEYGDKPLRLWIVRVWEPNPSPGVDRLEWFLLTNHPVASFEAAWEVVGWYECRWIVEMSQADYPPSAALYQLAA
ncbi:MAG: IS4 family transposase [Planctomycetota bacterium]|nr:IS4 family transposase [Planctomycetota bacterium]